VTVRADLALQLADALARPHKSLARSTGRPQPRRKCPHHLEKRPAGTPSSRDSIAPYELEELGLNRRVLVEPQHERVVGPRAMSLVSALRSVSWDPLGGGKEGSSVERASEASVPDENANAAGSPKPSAETRLRGWACKIRTGESVLALPDWNYVTIRPEVGAIRAAETLRVPAV